MQRSKFNSESTITIRCSVYAATELLPLLKELKTMGNRGNSRGIKIEDYDGKNRFGFDGDGPSSIDSITHDGKLIKSKIKASCGDELEYKLRKEGKYIEDKKKKKKKRAITYVEEDMEKAKKMPIGTISHGRKKVAEGRWVKVKQTGGKSNGGLPQDISKLTAETATSLIAQAVKMPLKTLRRNQDIVEQQSEMAYKKKNDKAMHRLAVMGEMYTAAVDIKSFKDSTPKEWATDIVHRIQRDLKIEEDRRKNMDLTKGKAGTRGVPDGSGPDGKGATGRQLGGCPRREGFESDEEYEKAFRRWQKANKVKKSRMEGKKEKLKKSGMALVLIPGELTKAAKLSGVGSTHPAKLSGVSGKTKSGIPYTGHVERMKLTKMAAARMLAPKPESEGKYADNPAVDRKGRVKGEKPPYNKYATGVSGMGSQAHDNFGRATVIVKPSDIGTSTPESSTAHTPVSNMRKPRK